MVLTSCRIRSDVIFQGTSPCPGDVIVRYPIYHLFQCAAPVVWRIAMAESPRSRASSGIAECHITLDTLAGDWRILQLRTGHRFSADDLLTAWTAVRANPAARQVLDLGACIGSVGLLVLWQPSPVRHL